MLIGATDGNSKIKWNTLLYFMPIFHACIATHVYAVLEDITGTKVNWSIVVQECVYSNLLLISLHISHYIKRNIGKDCVLYVSG
jgi:hypothetical protein